MEEAELQVSGAQVDEGGEQQTSKSQGTAAPAAPAPITAETVDKAVL